MGTAVGERWIDAAKVIEDQEVSVAAAWRTRPTVTFFANTDQKTVGTVLVTGSRIPTDTDAIGELFGACTGRTEVESPICPVVCILIKI